MVPHFDSHLVYALHPKKGGLSRQLVGKYLTHDGTIHVVSDHQGILNGLDGQKLSKVQSQVDSLHDARYFDVVKKDLKFHEPGSQHEDQAWEDEVFGGGGAQPRDFAKSAREAFEMFIPLQKADLNESFDSLRALVQAGHLHPDHYDALRREMYQDEMVPSIGNKRAFRDFMKAGGRSGVHTMLDANGLKGINDQLGHESGDQAIIGMGEALRRAVDKTVGDKGAKIHRFGGDEFHLHTPTVEHAHQVMRQLRSELESVPPLKGTHKLSMSAGVGANPSQADEALYHAKAASKSATQAAGGDPNARIAAPGHLYVHSLHPDHPGAVPVESYPTAPPAPMAKSEAEHDWHTHGTSSVDAPKARIDKKSVWHAAPKHGSHDSVCGIKDMAVKSAFKTKGSEAPTSGTICPHCARVAGKA